MIVTADELGDPHMFGIRAFVNGELRQQPNTSQLIFDCFRTTSSRSKSASTGAPREEVEMR